MTSTSVALGPRGTGLCRGCAATGLRSVLDLGSQPLANEMGASPDDDLDAFPLHLRICPSCGLGQVGEFVLPERIFGSEYPYLSSTSTSWLDHARRYAAAMTHHLGLGPGSFVLEIASNDGYLLSAFADAGVRVLGVEPAAGVAGIARGAGIETVGAFFGPELAETLVAEHGHPDLVVANNVMAHVPDLEGFVRGLAILAGPGTTITVENPSLLTLMLEGQFDTIYHEHFSYLTAHAVDRVVRPHNLRLVRVESLPTHGGSNRYWIRPAGAHGTDPSVTAMLAEERDRGLFDPDLWRRFASSAHEAIDGLRSWLEDRSSAGSRVAGYGAPAKGNTFLNAVGSRARTIAFTVDASPHKQGRYLPGSRIPVLAPTALAEEAVDDILILPWNLVDELAALIRPLRPDARIWVALPGMREVR